MKEFIPLMVISTLYCISYASAIFTIKLFILINEKTKCIFLSLNSAVIYPRKNIYP